jgi:hypothetical protein
MMGKWSFQVASILIQQVEKISSLRKVDWLPCFRVTSGNYKISGKNDGMTHEYSLAAICHKKEASCYKQLASRG